jgi:hypothetical protein
MNEEQELQEMEAWLAELWAATEEDDFRAKARPYFDNTGELNKYVEYKGRHRA